MHINRIEHNVRKNVYLLRSTKAVQLPAPKSKFTSV